MGLRARRDRLPRQRYRNEKFRRCLSRRQNLCGYERLGQLRRHFLFICGGGNFFCRQRYFSALAGSGNRLHSNFENPLGRDGPGCIVGRRQIKRSLIRSIISLVAGGAALFCGGCRAGPGIGSPFTSADRRRRFFLEDETGRALLDVGDNSQYEVKEDVMSTCLSNRALLEPALQSFGVDTTNAFPGFLSLVNGTLKVRLAMIRPSAKLFVFGELTRGSPTTSGAGDAPVIRAPKGEPLVVSLKNRSGVVVSFLTFKASAMMERDAKTLQAAGHQRKRSVVVVKGERKEFA